VRLHFADCTFDSDTRELLREGKPVHVSPKGFHLLELLLENRPKALSKAEIHEAIWPDAFISEASLASLISEIRGAIGQADLVRTVHGYGYAFPGAVTTARRVSPGTGEADVGYRLIWGTREIALSEGENVLGRDREAAVWINDSSVSRRHARIFVSGGSAQLEDLGSKNGTFVAGKPIEKPRALSDGDEIRLGSVSLVVRACSDAGSTATAIEPIGKPRRG
jgi:DNA-binding winged helix-turn-helix (wHTH) protein